MRNYKILASSLLMNLKPPKWVIIVYILLFTLSLLTFWDYKKESIFLFGAIDLYDVTLSSIKEESFKTLFYDLYSTFWLVLILIYIPNKLIFPLSYSFSVNQNLWIRFLPSTSIIDIALSRVYTLIYCLSIISVASFIWIIFYSALKNVRIVELLIPLLGLIGHIVIASGLALLVCSDKKSSASVRKSFAYLLLFLPILLYLIGDSTAKKLGGFFPYASPFSVKYGAHIVIRPFLTTLIIGTLLVFYYLVRNFHIKSKIIKNERLHFKTQIN